MATADVMLPTEPTTLYYYLEMKDGGMYQTYPGTAYEKRRKHVPHEMHIRNMRSIRSEFKLDECGFELVDHVSKEKTFDDEHRVEEVYYPEVIDLMKKLTGASDVRIVSHLCRRATTSQALEAAEGKDDKEFVTVINPARFTHVDQSYRGAEQLLYLNLGDEEADRLLKKRWGIYNIWQPFGKKVTRDPLALCDFRSLDENDFRTVVANLPPPGKGQYANVSKNQPIKMKERFEYDLNGERSARYEVANLAHNPNQKFYFASEMTPEEAWVFKIFDSKKDGRARCVPHTSFPLPGQPDYGEARTSVEVRCFLFWDDEETE